MLSWLYREVRYTVLIFQILQRIAMIYIISVDSYQEKDQLNSKLTDHLNHFSLGNEFSIQASCHSVYHVIKCVLYQNGRHIH